MADRGFFEPKRISPTSLVIVIALHGAALTALALSKSEFITERIKPTKTVFIPIPPDPAPVPDKPVENKQPVESNFDVVEPLVDRPRVSDQVYVDPTPRPPDLSDVRIPPPVRDPVVTEPVRREAQFDPRFAERQQPPYPSFEERAEMEGTVAIRVTIGADGRVKAAEKVSATTDGFYRATHRHALSQWRFKPATLDGKPVESSRVLTVRFELKD